MIQLLKIEWHKIKSYAVFWVITGILLVLFLAVAIGAATANFKINVFYSAGFDTQKFFQFPFVWSSFAYLGVFFSHLLALLMIILIGNEFNYRMMRQQLVFGTERTQILLSKILLILFLPILMFILMIILSLTFGLIYTENISFDKIINSSFFALNSYVQMVAFMSLGMLISLFLRSTGLSIIVYLGYIFFEAIFRLFVRAKLEDAVFFFPVKSISSLTPRPSINTAMNDVMKQQMNGFNDATMHFNEIITLIIPVVYVGIFLYLSYIIIKKRDL